MIYYRDWRGHDLLHVVTGNPTILACGGLSVHVSTRHVSVGLCGRIATVGLWRCWECARPGRRAIHLHGWWRHRLRVELRWHPGGHR